MSPSECRVAFKSGILCAIKTGLIFLYKTPGLEDGVVQEDYWLLLRIGSGTKEINVAIGAQAADDR